MAEKDPSEGKVGESRPLVPLAQVIGIGLNALVLFSALVFVFYTHFFFKKEVLTDESERKRLHSLFSKPVGAQVPTFVTLKSLTINLAPEAGSPTLHFATLEISLLVREAKLAPLVETWMPYLIDQVIVIVGSKHFYEISTAQGRYLLSTEILKAANQIILGKLGTDSKNSPSSPDGLDYQQKPILKVYFKDFILQ